MSERVIRAGRARVRLAGVVAGVGLASVALASPGHAVRSAAEKRPGTKAVVSGYAPESGLAARLLRLDPGARLGANTQLATAEGAVLAGVPGRVNFMMGLGPRQRIVGGAEHDQIGARGHGTRVRGGRGHDLIHGMHGRQFLAGGPGHDHIFGGPGADRLHGGPGDDLLVDRQGATVVVPGPGTNRVHVADGDGDERVVCAPGSINRIRADRDDRIHPNCRLAESSVRYPRADGGGPGARVAQARYTGDGSATNPYTAPCDDETQDPCDINAFAARSLTGLWKNEFVPAYKCPSSHPYLYDQRYAPPGTSLIDGVSVSGLGPIGVSITGFTSIDLATVWRATGAQTGTFNSSATNWTTGTNSYQVTLVCTKDANSGWGGPR